MIVTCLEVAECDDAMAAPVVHEAVPWPMEYDGTLPADREAMPGPVECGEAMTAVDGDAVLALGA